MPKDLEPVLVPLERIGTMGKLQQLRRRLPQRQDEAFNGGPVRLRPFYHKLATCGAPACLRRACKGLSCQVF